MIRAYDKVYLEKAQTTLARMLDFAVYDLGYDITEFFDMFINSGIAKKFGRGDFTLIAGKSGVELTYEVIEKSDVVLERVTPRYTVNRSAEFWAGWALAYYQWYTGLDFKEIVKTIPVKNILEMYSPYHEMDIKQFANRLNEIYIANNSTTNLKKMRLNAGLSQSQLAEQSGVPVRTIQQYEQRQKNINNAKVDYLVKISRALHCDIEMLIEWVECD